MKKNFEASLEELEKIVERLEDGDLSIEESLQLFENGVKLARNCREHLANAERRVEMLMKEAGGDMVVTGLDEITDDDDDPQPAYRNRIVFDD